MKWNVEEQTNSMDLRKIGRRYCNLNRTSISHSHPIPGKNLLQPSKFPYFLFSYSHHIPTIIITHRTLHSFGPFTNGQSILRRGRSIFSKGAEFAEVARAELSKPHYRPTIKYECKIRVKNFKNGENTIFESR